MNPIAIVHGIVAVVSVLIALPLVRRRVKRNAWYGVRISESYKSEDRWYEINEYGGRLLIYWAALIALLSASGLFIEREHWPLYSAVSTSIMLAGLGGVIVKIFRYAAKTRTSDSNERSS